MINLAAQNLNIELPVPQERVKQTIERLYVVNEQIRQAQRAVAALITLVQDGCEHPEKVPVSHCGERAMRCTTCGREW